MNTLTNKVALITESSSGLGKAIAERYAAMGADIVINYLFDKTAALEVVSNIEAMGSKAIAVQADVLKPIDIERLFAETIMKFGKIDIVVASTTQTATVTKDFIPGNFDELFSLHTSDAHITMQYAVKNITSYGRIIFIASNAASDVPSNSDYGRCKTFILHLVDFLAKEIGYRGVTVNAILAFDIDKTGIFSEQGNYPELRKKIIAENPMGRLGQIKDVADAAEFFASDFSSFISGQYLLVSGGLNY